MGQQLNEAPHMLLACLLRRGDVQAVKVLLSSYADEWSAYWLLPRHPITDSLL
jgi:hypothetical protein